jgi:hypothetical protein
MLTAPQQPVNGRKRPVRNTEIIEETQTKGTLTDKPQATERAHTY